MAHASAGSGSMPSMSADQLEQFLELLRSVDSVELKLTVPDADRRATVAGLGLDPLDAQIRQIVFFDTADLALDRGGVVVRARRIQGSKGDSVIKLRPVEPAQLSDATRALPGFGVEVDASPGGFVCSASMKASADDATIKAVLFGGKPVHKVFSKHQREFFTARAPDGIELDDLLTLGPITVFKLKFTPKALQRRVVAELWFYPDGSRILELSTKSSPAEAFQTIAETKAFIATHGVDLAAPQQTKTRSALEFFAAELALSAEQAQGSNR